MENQQYVQQYNRPIFQLKTNRSLVKLILLSMVTFGIYAIVVYCGISESVNTVASRNDGKHTMHFALLLFLIGPLTFGIAYLVWFHNISNRIGYELRRRNIPTSFDASSYWIWNVLGSVIIIGPFIYAHKLLTSTNQLCESYNINGY